MIGLDLTASRGSERLEDLSELLLIAESAGVGGKRLCDVFLCDPGNGRVRNDAGDCADAHESDPSCNNKSNGATAPLANQIVSAKHT